MQEFITQAAAKLGVGSDAAESATGGLLSLVKEHAAPADVSEMLGKLPGASALMDKVRDQGAPEGGGGLLGGLGDTLGSALGGAAGPALSGLGALTRGGLPMDKLGDFLGLFKQFVQPKLGGELLQRLLGSVPGIGKLLG